MRKTVLILCLLFSFVYSPKANAQYNRAYFFYTGRLFLVNENYLEAVKTLNILLSAYPNSHEGYFLRGIAKYNLEDLIGAQSDFTKAIHHNPVYTNAYQYRAITRSRLGNYLDALDDFAQTIELRPDIAGTFYSRGVTYLLSGENDKAIKDFDEFIKREPRVVDAYLNRGTAYLQQQDTLQALENYNLAIKTKPNHAESYNRRGSINLKQKNYQPALEDFNRAIELDSTSLSSYFNRALTYANTNKLSLALEDFNHIIEVDSTTSIAYFNRALLRTQIGDYNNAMKDYNTVASHLPDNLLVYYNRSLLHHKLGNLESALDDCDKAIELFPDFVSAYTQRSRVKYLLSDTKGAQQDKDTAEKLIKKNKTTDKIYADTTNNFSRLISFDLKSSGSELFRIKSSGATIALLPSFMFILEETKPITDINPGRFYSQKIENFKELVGEELLTLSNKKSQISTDSIITLNKKYSQSEPTWQNYFLQAVAQKQIKQYTSSIKSYSAAIDNDPRNALLYFNRSSARSEMIDFISSLDGNIQRVTLSNDPSTKLKGSFTRQYDYKDAVADLNKAAVLMPDFAHIYYNRANLHAISADYQAAYDDYTKAIELYPSFAEAYYNRGLVLIYQKQIHKGCIDISKAAELGIENGYEILKIYTK